METPLAAAKRIYVDQTAAHGRFANQLIRYFFATHLHQNMPGSILTGYHFPDFALSDPGEPTGRVLQVKPEHKFDIGEIIEEAADYDCINVRAYAARMEYFACNRALFIGQLNSKVAGHPISDREIAICVRAGDIVLGANKDYWPVPVSYHRRLVERVGLKPVLVGEIGSDYYSEALRNTFPDARQIKGTPIEIFQTIRNARHVAVAIGTFSWLAAWLSTSARTIHVPVLGFLNPKQRPDVDLLPRDDRRYYFHEFPVESFTASNSQKCRLTNPNAFFYQGVEWSPRLWSPQRRFGRALRLGLTSLALTVESKLR